MKDVHRSYVLRKSGTSQLSPTMLDELVTPDVLVRVIEAWVESLDMQDLGFQKAQAKGMGRPPYAPTDLLKLYLCDYLNAVRFSRALEYECNGNVEVIWLLGRLSPDHKTIANLRSKITAKHWLPRVLHSSSLPDKSNTYQAH
ncbi:MAG: transposase [Burkholderiaceae bacterium]|nr:transposase [Burkholderiaceae bacterium]